MIASAIVLASLMDSPMKSMPTRWTAEAEAAAVPLAEHPRPQLYRPDWRSLNGMWSLEIAGANPWRGEIRVPFPVESRLSGVSRPVAPEDRLIYRRTIDLSPAEAKGAVLNIEACDWATTVRVNGQEAGRHQGGFDAIRLDITHWAKAGANEIEIEVTDPTDSGQQPRGKQVRNPSGIWYTAVSGIWGSVWLESYDRARFTDCWTETKMSGDVTLHADVAGAEPGDRVRAVATLRGAPAARAEAGAGEPLAFKVANPALWSPESPSLYDVALELVRGGEVIERAESYFGIREVGLSPSRQMLLNGQPVFMMGLLDQGWWPDGLFTAPTDEALRWDLELTKRMGFNTVRKHVKVEPARWHRHADEIGLLVWQDMPSGGPTPRWQTDPTQPNPAPDADRPAESAAQYRAELTRLVESRRWSPSLVMWVPFNEAWGQHATSATTDFLRQLDPTRWINSASGGNFTPDGDVLDIHSYPGPSVPPQDPSRALVLGEFGGLGLPVAGRLWQESQNWGYRTLTQLADLETGLDSLFAQLNLMRGEGLQAAIYTQTTDVEIEVNGLATYDRYVKVDVDRMRRRLTPLYGPAPTMRTLIPTADQEPQTWRWTTDAPAEGWMAADFNDKAWPEGRSCFGSFGTPGARIGTEWTSSDIWIRREFDFAETGGSLWMRVLHDEDAEIYINGKLAAELTGYIGSYGLVKIPSGLLKKGRNTIAAHCHQTRGGQSLDIGLVQVETP